MDGLDNAVVGAASAQVAAQALTDLLRRPLGGAGLLRWGDRAGHAALELAQHSDRRAQLTRRAVAALKAVALDERRLQRVQDLTAGQALRSEAHTSELQSRRDPVCRL